MVYIKRLSLFVCAALLANLLVPQAAALDETPEESNQPPFDGYIVKLSDDTPLVMTLDADTKYDEDGNFLVVDSLEQAEDIPQDCVEYIEPNYYVELFSADNTAPDDDYYASYQWNLQQIGAMTAYNRGLYGEGVKVAFIDSGVNKAHEDFDSTRITGKNFNIDGNAYDNDSLGHGTFTAGIVGAQTNNGKGLAGIAPKSSIMEYRVFSSGNTTTLDTVVSAINAAVDDGCKVMNLSLGTDASSETLLTAIRRAETNGVIMVAAVGNDGSSALQYPAAYGDVIGVGSVDSGLTVSNFSQKNSSVFVTAPGGGVASLSNTGTAAYELDLTSTTNMGTSFAAPVVTGMAALALGYDSDIKESGIRYLLKKTSVEKGTEGYDNTYGYGVVNIDAFVQELQRAYAITYYLNGGTLPVGAATSYLATDSTLTLPTPTLNSYAFAGWYTAPDLGGAPVTSIPAGSVGDVTLYAAWQADSTTAVSSVMADGQAAALQADGTYLALLPYGTDLSALTAANIAVTPADSSSVAGAATTTDGGTTWTFTVTSAGTPSASRTYTLKLAVAQLHVASGMAAQNGTATPVSNDGFTAAVPYAADAAAWFANGESGSLPSDFICTAQPADGVGTLSVSGTQITYTPAAADAGKTVTLTVRGAGDGVTTLDTVTVTIAVNALPVSNTKALQTAVGFDRYIDSEAVFPLALYGNTVTDVTVDSTALTSGQYTVSEVTTDGSVQLSVSRAALAACAEGEHTVTIASNAGTPCTVTLTVADTAPLYTVTFMNQGSIYDIRSDVREGSTVTLPTAPARDSYTFGGWYTGQSGAGTAFTAETAVTAGLTVYAYWKEQSAPIGGGGGGGGAVATAAVTDTTNTIIESGGTTTLTCKADEVTSDESKTLVKNNKTGSVVLSGKGLKVTIPQGTLPEGFDINRLMPDLSGTTGADGEVLVYTDDSGETHALPWVIVGAGTVTFTAGVPGTYQIVDRAATFGDVEAGGWYQGAVGFVTARGLFTGTSENHFMPDGTMTRAMLVTVLNRLAAGQDKYVFEAESPAAFSDVPEGTWYTDAVKWAGGAGLVGGVGGGRFDPDGKITREQMAVILYRFAGQPALTAGQLEFTDAGEASDGSFDALVWATTEGLLSGKGNHRLDPRGSATRAEVSAILQRFIKL